VEFEQRLEQGFVDAPDGRRAITDSAARALAVLHVDARDSLRVVWQGARLTRPPDPGLVLAARDERSDVVSLVFQRRFGIGRSLAVGASRQRERFDGAAAGTRETELLAKFSFELGS
jgi:hypothetical protein